MPRVHLPADKTSSCVRDIFVRISTPSDPDAAEIDRALESVVFLHPIWTDGYFLWVAGGCLHVAADTTSRAPAILSSKTRSLPPDST